MQYHFTEIFIRPHFPEGERLFGGVWSAKINDVRVCKLMCWPTGRALSCRLSIKVMFSDEFGDRITGWGKSKWILCVRASYVTSKRSAAGSPASHNRCWKEFTTPTQFCGQDYLTWPLYGLLSKQRVFNYSRKPVLYHWRWFNGLLFGCSTNGSADKINKLCVFIPTNQRMVLKTKAWS